MGMGPHALPGGGEDGWRAMGSPTAGISLPEKAWLDFLPVIKDCSSF